MIAPSAPATAGQLCCLALPLNASTTVATRFVKFSNLICHFASSGQIQIPMQVLWKVSWPPIEFDRRRMADVSQTYRRRITFPFTMLVLEYTSGFLTHNLTDSWTFFEKPFWPRMEIYMIAGVQTANHDPGAAPELLENLSFLVLDQYRLSYGGIGVSIPANYWPTPCIKRSEQIGPMIHEHMTTSAQQERRWLKSYIYLLKQIIDLKFCIIPGTSFIKGVICMARHGQA